MKKIGKYLAIVLGIFAVVVVVFAVLAKILITPERVRSTVLPIAEEALHRKVELGDIDVSIFSGISLKQLRIHERQGEEDFVSADRLVLRYRFWPLLMMRVVVDEVRLEDPKIRVERLADGSFNFSDLLSKEKSAEPKDETPPTTKAESKGSGINLLVSQVTVSGGELLFLDRSMSTEAPYRYKLSDLAISAKDISLEKAFPLSVSAKIGDAVLNIQGEVNAKDARAEAQIVLTSFDVTPFTPYFKDKLPGKLGALKVSLDLKVGGSVDALNSQGKISLSDVDLVLDALKDAPIHNAALALTYDLNVDRAKDTLDLGKTTLSFNGLNVSAQGTVADFSSNPTVDMSVELPDLDIRAALDALPAGLVPDLGGLDPAGKVNARFHLAGSAQEPLKMLRDGEVNLNGVQASAGGVRPALSGTIALAGDTLNTKNLQVKMGDNMASIDLNVSNLFGKPIHVVNHITADKFLVDPLLKGSAAASQESSAETQAGTSAPATDLGPFDIPVSAVGDVKIAQVVYRKLTIENLDLKYRLENNVLHVENLTGKMAGGTFNESGTVDLGKKGLIYSSDLKIQGVQANPLVSAFMPESANSVQGGLDLSASIKGQGTTMAGIRRHLSGQGDFLFKDGQLSGTALAKGLSDFLAVPELRDLNVKESRGSFTIQNGKVILQSSFTGKDARLNPNGSLGLDGSLDLSLDLRLSPDLTKKVDGKGGVTKFLSDSEGWGRVPLRLSGTVSKPKFSLDTSAAKEQVKEKAQQELQKQLEKKLFKNKESSGTESDSTEAPEKKLLKDTIKGLFGN